MNSLIRVSLILSFTTVICGCKGGFEASDVDQASVIAIVIPPSSPAELQSKVTALLQAKCTVCHNATQINGGLGSPLDLTELLAKGFVVPGGAANSILYQSVEQNRMPQGTPLLDEEKQLIRDWIISAVPNLPVEPISFAPTMAILQAKCVSCHSGVGGNPAGINLETYAGARVAVMPGAPNLSLLFDSVVKQRMPALATPKLTLKELATVYGWIFAGAAEAGKQ